MNYYFIKKASIRTKNIHESRNMRVFVKSTKYVKICTKKKRNSSFYETLSVTWSAINRKSIYNI